jgi:flagellar L-ring protein FlgH
MKKITLFSWIMLLALMVSVTLQAQYPESAARSLFSDVKAYQAGDVVTILIIEDTEADNTANTNTSSSTTLSLGVGAGVGSTNLNGDARIGTGNQFQGRGQTNRSERVRARLSARITEATNLNALKIEGKRNVTINGENQTISISGYVRFIDIQPDNSVFSYNMSDLTLNYNGDGTITKAQEPGLFTKFLRFLF